MKRSYAWLAVLFLALALVPAVPAWAVLHQYYANLSGPGESPANNSAGTGYTRVDYDDAAHTLSVRVQFGGLTGNTTASHIHAPTALPGSDPLVTTAGVATTTPTFAGFPLGVKTGLYANVLDLTQSSSWNPAYVTSNGGTTAGAESALFAAIQADKSYLNIHSSTFGGGEIRGFLLPVPEPGSCGLFALGAAALCAWLHAQRRA